MNDLDFEDAASLLIYDARALAARLARFERQVQALVKLKHDGARVLRPVAGLERLPPTEDLILPRAVAHG